MSVDGRHTKERGDTLVEVLVALSVLAIVLVGIFSLMNKGVARVYDSMERVEVRAVIDRQIESLIYARDEYIKSLTAGSSANVYDTAAANAWRNIRNNSWVNRVSSVTAVDQCYSTSPPSQAFFIDRATAIGGENVIVAKRLDPGQKGVALNFPEPGKGLWIQKRVDSTSPVPYIDLYIKACWPSTENGSTQYISSIVRLYDK